MVGGNFEDEAQGLSFPRAYLYTKEGILILGVPKKLKQAVCEYVFRAKKGTLTTDPVIGTGGQSVDRVRKKVGPLETEFYYGGSIFTYGSFPQADGLMKEFLGYGGGRVYR
jgi:hypothetical protein